KILNRLLDRLVQVYQMPEQYKTGL
ncbi:MAG: hypothetical protein ACI9YH_003292, partial [Colwellia sp.]